MARHCRRLGGSRLWLLGRRATICESSFVSLEKMTPSLNAPLFAAAPTPAASRGVRVTLYDGPTLSETRGQPFVAPRAACHNMRVNFCIFGKNDTEPQRSPVCCCSDASSQRGCAIDIVRWPDTVGDSKAAVCGFLGGGGKVLLFSCLVFYSTVFFASRHDFCFW